MQVNSVSQRQNTPSFGKINLYAGARETLKTVIKGKNLDELKDIVAKEVNNPVDINIFGEINSKKLSAKVIGDPKIHEKSQRFLESPMHFIKRLVKIAKKELELIKENKKYTNFDDIEF